MDRTIGRNAVAAGLAIVTLAAALSCGGCRRSRSGGVHVMGSTSVHPFAEMLAQDFNRKHPQMQVQVEGGGSTVGIRAVADGLVDIGMSSRALKSDEQFPTEVIAWDGIAVVVYMGNPVSNLTREQLRGMFEGRITNWSQVGGQDRPIRLVTREEGSGTREAFATLVMDEHKEQGASPASRPHSRPAAAKGKKTTIHHLIHASALTQESNGAVRELVRDDPAAIGYMSLGIARPDPKSGEKQVLKVLRVDGVEANRATVKSKKYPLVRPFLFLWKDKEPSAGARKYIDFVLSPEGQQALEREGLVGAREEAGEAVP